MARLPPTQRLAMVQNVPAHLQPSSVALIVDALMARDVATRELHAAKDGNCVHCSFLAGQPIPHPCPTRKISGDDAPCICGKCT